MKAKFGRVGERFNPASWKGADPSGSVGSNPTPSARSWMVGRARFKALVLKTSTGNTVVRSNRTPSANLERWQSPAYCTGFEHRQTETSREFKSRPLRHLKTMEIHCKHIVDRAGDRQFVIDRMYVVTAVGVQSPGTNCGVEQQ